MSEIRTPKKLIEVALPLDDINTACAYEKMPGIGSHPRGIHHWWARRPLAAARAVLFAQLVNDPGYERNLGRGVNKESAQLERERLFEIIRKLVKWENTNNSALLAEAHKEIVNSWKETCELNKSHPNASELFNPDVLPAFHDPFAGGGAIPLEAQRLGLHSNASDLNPVAVLINKAMIEIPAKFSGCSPVGPIQSTEKQLKFQAKWNGVEGLAEDVRRYGHWMLNEVNKSIGHLYPQAEITSDIVKSRPDLKPYLGQKLTVIAWIWARTVKSPNPAFSHAHVPLLRSFSLSSKKGKESWIEPVINGDNYTFKVNVGGKPNLAGTVVRTGGICLLSQTPIDLKYIRAEGKAGRIGNRLMAVVVEAPRGRFYLSPSKEMEDIAQVTLPENLPETELPAKALSFRVQEYGLTKHRHIHTNRQLVALSTLSDLIPVVKEKVLSDALNAGWSETGNSGSPGAIDYSNAIATYLSFSIDRAADFNNSLTGWRPGNEKIMNLFNRQAVPMVWDFGEANILADVVGGFPALVKYQSKCIAMLPATNPGKATMVDAMQNTLSYGKVVSTDPPYYDNIGYADLSDFFYTWLRRSLKPIYPDLFSTLLVPKNEELIASPFRHGNKDAAEAFFMNGMSIAMHQLAENAHPAYPVTIYYAFKQSDTGDLGTVSTGWETFLDAVLKAGFSITGTWPMRSEQECRMIGMGTNALASSIILVCRKRTIHAETVSRRDFVRALKESMPDALNDMIGGKEGSSPVAPVDLAQASIGPGMAVYSKFNSIVEADGTAMSVHTALGIINKEIDDYFGAQSFDADTNFCISWFEENDWKAGQYGQAELLATAKGTSVNGVKEAGVIESGAGNVRLLKYSEYPADWNPEQDNRTPVWEALHQLIRAIQSDGETVAGALLARMPERGESIRQLAYRLYTLCERKGWAEDARPYNELITAWHEVEKASHEVGHVNTQIEMNLQ